MSKYEKRYAKEIVTYFETTLNDRTSKGIIKAVPSYVAFARKIGVTARTLENWKKNKKEFADACLECDELMKSVIVGDCLLYKMHASFGKFLLSSRYGMNETVHVNSGDEGTVELTPEMRELLALKKKRDGNEDKER